jgi:cytochrome c-type biogenesis protein CcmE
VWPGLVLAVVAGIGLAAGMRLWSTSSTTKRVPAPHLCGGVVARGWLVSESPTLHRFRLESAWGDVPMCDRSRVEVRYRGPLPDTLCDGAEVAVSGYVDGDHFEAVEVFGRVTSKYDPCRGRCRGEPPPECRERQDFE